MLITIESLRRRRSGNSLGTFFLLFQARVAGVGGKCVQIMTQNELPRAGCTLSTFYLRATRNVLYLRRRARARGDKCFARGNEIIDEPAAGGSCAITIRENYSSSSRATRNPRRSATAAIAIAKGKKRPFAHLFTDHLISRRRISLGRCCPERGSRQSRRYCSRYWC